METWTDKGVPYAETRRRLAERSNGECRAADRLFRQAMNSKQRKTILGIADKLRDTSAVLDVYEPTWIKTLERECPDLGTIKIHWLLEVNALAIEHYLRGPRRK